MKFNKLKVYHQFVCIFSFFVFFSRLIKPALKNLDKFDYICCNGVAYEEKNKV